MWSCGSKREKRFLVSGNLDGIRSWSVPFPIRISVDFLSIHGVMCSDWQVSGILGSCGD